MTLLTRTEEILLLAVWRLQGDAYGISIREELAKATERTWPIGAVYAPLHRLEKKGYVTTRHGDPVPERGGRSKVYYELSQKGKQALLKTREVHDAIWTGIPLLDAK